MSDAANENKTFLYRIRRKEDGLFLECSPSHSRWTDHFGPVGCFWRKQETIKKHLYELCKFNLYCGGGMVVNTKSKRRRGPNQKRRDNINPYFVVYPSGTEFRTVSVNYEWLDRYEVIATEITVHGEQVMEAREFASFMEDLTKHERG